MEETIESAVRTEEEIWVDATRYAGAPEDLSGRSGTERAVYALLGRLGIPFFRVEHAPANTIAACHTVDRVLGTAMCKNLFLCNRQKTDFYLLLMPGGKPFRTKDLSRQINATRLSFADAAHMEEFLHIKPGAVSVLGLMHDRERRVRLLIDSDLLREERLGCHPCENTTSLSIAMRDLMEIFLPYTGHDYTAVIL